MRCVSMMRWENCHAFITERRGEKNAILNAYYIIMCRCYMYYYVSCAASKEERPHLIFFSSLLFFPGISVCFAKISIDGLKVRSVTNWQIFLDSQLSQKWNFSLWKDKKKRRERKEGPNKSKERLRVDHPDHWYHHHRVMSCLLLVIFSNLLYSPREVWRRRVSYD